MYFYSLIENCQLRIAALKFEFGCGFYFCVISALKYIIGIPKYGSYIRCRCSIAICEDVKAMFKIADDLVL